MCSVGGKKASRKVFPTFTNSLALLLVLVVFFTACQSVSPPPLDQGALQTQAFETALAQIQPTATPPPTDTPIPPPTVVRTPPALPSVYQSLALDPLDLPRTYIPDTCQYLKDKWSTGKAVPGTVVMIVMFHSITDDPVASGIQITAQDQRKLMNDLFESGFQAINMQQMADFMYSNAWIPARSVLLIVDDRHHADYFNSHFRSFYDQWGWPVVNAYIGLDERADLWAENASLSAEGWVDYQAHGYIHNLNITGDSTDDFITQEMQGAINSLQKYMNKTPIAYIWPGGGFSRRAVEIGRELGYKLGFTVNGRGPVMYNWVPQADDFSSSNPFAIPEVPAGDPLMTLPRYYDINARAQIDTVRQMGEEAAAYAEQNKAVEVEYYDIVCSQSLGPIQ